MIAAMYAFLLLAGAWLTPPLVLLSYWVARRRHRPGWAYAAIAAAGGVALGLLLLGAPWAAACAAWAARPARRPPVRGGGVWVAVACGAWVALGASSLL